MQPVYYQFRLNTNTAQVYGYSARSANDENE